MSAYLKPAIAVMTMLLLAGCGSSPPVRYFSLDPVLERVAQEGRAETIVGVGQLRTPNFLFRSQMVTRTDGGELIVHDFRRWSEPLDQAIHRVVAANVDGLLTDATVIAFPYESHARPDRRIYGNVERFDVDTGGLAVLVVQWGIIDQGGATLTPPHRTRYEAKAGAVDDPLAAVAALNEVLAAFSRDIAAQLD